MIMSFGRHRGKEVSDVPPDYLDWVLNNCDNISPFLRQEIETFLDLCEQKPSNALALPDILEQWYRQAAREFHPDRGGTHEGMKVVNRCRDLLVELGGAG